jgi:hypothetical protein
LEAIADGIRRDCQHLLPKTRVTTSGAGPSRGAPSHGQDLLLVLIDRDWMSAELFQPHDAVRI